MGCTTQKGESVIERWARDRLLLRDGDADYLSRVLTTVGALGCRGLWREVAGLLDSPEEEIVVAALDVLGDWEEVRAYPEILSLWESRRPGPRCAVALKRAVRALTGEPIESPAAFRAWLMS